MLINCSLRSLLYFRVSSILSDASAPIRLVTQFVAQILVFDVKIPMTKGDTVCLPFLLLRGLSVNRNRQLAAGCAALFEHERTSYCHEACGNGG